MTSTQRTASGLRFIARPKTTRIERIAFSVFRHWHWTGIVVSSMLAAGLMLLSITLAAGLHAEEPILSGTIGFLLAILLIAVPVWRVSRIELGVGQPPPPTTSVASRSSASCTSLLVAALAVSSARRRWPASMSCFDRV